MGRSKSTPSVLSGSPLRKSPKATNLIEQLNHQRYLTGRAHGELAEAKRVYKEKTAAFKKSFLEKNSLEILPDEEDDCYDAYRAQLKENCKKEHFKMQGWKTQESAVLSSFEIKKEKLEKEIKTFRKLALEWKEAKTKEAKIPAAKIPKKRKSNDLKKKSAKKKKATSPPQTPTPRRRRT